MNRLEALDAMVRVQALIHAFVSIRSRSPPATMGKTRDDFHSRAHSGPSDVILLVEWLTLW